MTFILKRHRTRNQLTPITCAGIKSKERTTPQEEKTFPYETSDSSGREAGKNFCDPVSFSSYSPEKRDRPERIAEAALIYRRPVK
ncbi:hypothetical protein GCM10023155_31930 [Bremerella cremea]